MGVRGPIPAREQELARPRERKGADIAPVTRGVLMPVKIPTADKDWHPIAKRFWKSLKTSGQSAYYQDSDWAFAYSLCDDLSMYKKPQVARDGTEYYKRSPEMLKAILSAMASLMVTEGDRRRVRLELHEPDDGTNDAELYAIEGYKAALGADEE